MFDPALEFTPQFFKPERGDQILNPLDTRMPYWSPGEEIQHRAEAMAFAKALFPDDRRDNRFFIESPRKIFARLLSFKPTAKEIASLALSGPKRLLMPERRRTGVLDTAIRTGRNGGKGRSCPPGRGRGAAAPGRRDLAGFRLAVVDRYG